MLWDEGDRKSKVEQMAMPRDGPWKPHTGCLACLEIASAVT